jgi:dolichol-phosphate mannosyltransferase
LHPSAGFVDKTAGFAVVLPTFNERANVAEIIGKLEAALHGRSWEIIFVDDDSPDGTAGLVEEIARGDPRIRLIHRIGRRGLSSACAEGILATSARYVAVMDADMQHDETILPRMLTKLCDESLDIVIGTRNADGGSMGEFSSRRVLLSRLGKRISNAICHADISDPMSGFFLLDRHFFMKVVHRLHAGGFKILVDMLASSEEPVRFGEVGYTFRSRRHGASKLDMNTAVEYGFLIISKITGGLIPVRFALFAAVGATGLVTHLLCLTMLLKLFHASFTTAQIAATIVAMTENFFLNNLITYRDRKLRGLYLVWGLISFWTACSLGAWANLVFAKSLLQLGARWYVAGLAGTVLSSVWNYSVSSLFTWRMPQRRQMQEAANASAAELMAAGEPH